MMMMMMATKVFLIESLVWKWLVISIRSRVEMVTLRKIYYLKSQVDCL